MGSDSEQFENTAPAMTAGSCGRVEPAGDSGDMLGQIRVGDALA